MIHLALNNLQTVLAALKTDSARIRLPEKMINARIASSYLWVGQAYLDLGESRKARTFLLKGLWREPHRLRPWALLILSCFPNRLRRDLRNLVRFLRRKLKS